MDETKTYFKSIQKTTFFWKYLIQILGISRAIIGTGSWETFKSEEGSRKGAIQYLRKQKEVGRWSVKCLIL